MEHRRTDGTARRLLAAALAIVVMSALAALAGVGLARGSISAAQYQYGKVTICHKTKSKKHPQVTITVSRSALAAHLKHGDTEGACPKAAASNKGKGSEKKSSEKGAEKGSEKGAEKGAEKGSEKGADPPAKEKEKGEKEKGEKEKGGSGGENGGGQGNGNGGGGGKGKGK